MNIKQYNKLVRDAIPASLAAKNLAYEARSIADDAEFERFLKIKLLEKPGKRTPQKIANNF